jgi:hypothetical protein
MLLHLYSDLLRSYTTVYTQIYSSAIITIIFLSNFKCSLSKTFDSISTTTNFKIAQECYRG